MQGFQIGDHRVFFDCLGLQMQHKIRRTAIRLTDQGSQSVQAFPVEAMRDDRRLPTRRPGSAEAGFEGESTLIVEGQLGRLLLCPLFYPRPLLGKPFIDSGLVAFLGLGFRLLAGPV